MLRKKKSFAGTWWFLWGLWLFCAKAHAEAPTSRPISQTEHAKSSKESGVVFVGVDRLHKLLEKKRPAQGPAWVAGAARYEGEIAGRSLTLQVVREVRVERKRPTWIPLGGRGGVVWKVRVGKRMLAPTRRAGKGLWVLLPKGRYTLHYTMQMPVPKARGEHKLALDLPASPQAQLHLRFKGPDWSVHTEPASQVVMTHPKGETHAILRLPASGGLLLHWKGKRIERDEQTRFRASIQQWVTLQERLMSVRAQVQMEIVTGALRQIRCKVPMDVEVLHVGGKGVTEWYQVRREGKHQVLLIQLGYAVRDKQSLLVRMERPRLQVGKAVEIPELQVLGAEEVNGDIGVQARADTEVSHESAQGATPVDVRSLSGTIRSGSDLPILLAYRFEQAGWSVGVRVVKHPPLKVISIVVNSARFDTVYTRAGREVTKATWWVTNNRRQFMPIFLSKDSEVMGTFVAGRAVQIAETKRTEKGERLLLVPLVRSKSMSVGKVFPVEVLYTVQREPLRMWGAFKTSLPRTTLEVLSFQWNVYLARSHRMIWQGGNVLPTHRRRLMRYLEKRLHDDLKEGTPVLWAGGWRRAKRSRLNIYSSMGLKERFAAPLSAADVVRNAPKSEYRSRFAQVQWQVRAEIPLVGRLISLQGHMMRNRSPRLEVFYVQGIFLSGWFWFVLLAVSWLTWLFLLGCFSSQGVRWSWLVFAVVGCLALFVSGLLLPMTYLAGARGLFFGLWVALLYRFGTLENSFFPIWAKISRWGMVFLTFIFLLDGSFGSQVSCLFLALPFFPALFGKKGGSEPSDPPSSPQKMGGTPPPLPSTEARSSGKAPLGKKSEGEQIESRKETEGLNQKEKKGEESSKEAEKASFKEEEASAKAQPRKGKKR